MHLFIFTIALTTLLSTAAPLSAQDLVFKNSGPKATLVELYSSEGCSSCPPAESWVNDLKTSPALWTTLFPVAFHVDYWDGLGWPDRFAKPVYTQRQQNYAAALGQNSVYTPEFVVSGREWRGWFHGQSLPAPAMTGGELSLHVTDGGKSVSAAYVPAPSGPHPTAINVALLGAGILSDVRGGENGGRKLEHDFIVLDFASKPLAGRTSFQSGPITLQSSTNDSPAAIVGWVSAADGTVLQISGGWLKPLAATAGLHP